MVLDNCMGSGTSGVACQNLGRNFIGIEKELNTAIIKIYRIN
jgi:DNA modification methylase